jgi:hypothetical protein
MTDLTSEWRELEADALASDGRITDADVKNAIRRHRAAIEQAAIARDRAGLVEVVDALTEGIDWLETRPDYTEGDAATAGRLRDARHLLDPEAQS